MSRNQNFADFTSVMDLKANFVKKMTLLNQANSFQHVANKKEGDHHPPQPG
jgi:hypothetical protein